MKIKKYIYIFRGVGRVRGVEGSRVGSGGKGGCERRSEAFMIFFFFWGGGGSRLRGGGGRLGVVRVDVNGEVKLL